MTNEKNITQKVSNFRVNIKNVKSRFNELNSDNFRKINNINNNSRNLQSNIENQQNQNILLSSNNHTTEDFTNNVYEINDSTCKLLKDKVESDSSPKSPSSKKNSYLKSPISNNKLLTNNQAVAGYSNKYSNNILKNDNLHLKKKSNLSYNFINNFKLDLINKNTTLKKLGRISKKSNDKNSTSLKFIYDEQKEKKKIFDRNNKAVKINNNSEDNLIEVNFLSKEIKKKNNDNRFEINVANSENTTIFLDCNNYNDLLDSKEYETEISSNATLCINQIHTVNNKDDPNDHKIKDLNKENTSKNSDINGPEDLHFFYVNIFQKKRNYAPKFDY